MTVDIVYLRIFDDCLDVMTAITDEAKSVEEIRKELKRLKKLIRQNKFEKIQAEFGAKLF